MTEFALYLLKSASWIAGFALVYLVLLRNERYFALNRFYLLAGIVISFILPFITIHYTVDLSAPVTADAGSLSVSGISVVDAGNNDKHVISALLWVCIVIYAGGIIYLLSDFFIKTGSLIKAIHKADSDKSGRIKLIRTTLYSSSFSFFSWVFINPSISEPETREIVKHEEIHIRQKHWIDLSLSHLLCIIQWFNPLVWMYGRLVRQNHEYLADEEALLQSQDPALYRATLLNQMMGAPLFDLANFFSYSLTRQRFKMMKKIDYSPLRKLKMLAILPVTALLLFAFAEPQYRDASETDEISAVQPQKIVKGVVKSEAGLPLEGAAVVIAGTTVGTVTNAQGRFTLKEVPAGSTLIVSYVGYKTFEVWPSGNEEVNVKMAIATIGIDAIEVRSGNLLAVGKSEMENPPMVMVDGKRIDNNKIKDIDPNSIETISVLKDQSATAVFGDDGKNGVIVITTRNGQGITTQDNKNIKPVVVEGYALSNEAAKNTTPANKDLKPVVVEGRPLEETFTIVEEMPSFPGGETALKAWIVQTLKYPEDAVKKGLSGDVIVSFIVNKFGNVQDVKVVKSVAPILDNEAVRVIKSLPVWKPGKQSGKPVDVQFNVPVSFKL